MNRPPSFNLEERIRKAKPQLEQSGISYSLTYVGYVPVLAPVHQMGREIRESLIREVLLTMSALKNKLSPPTPLEITSKLMAAPKLLDIKVILTISAENITVIYDESEKEPYCNKLGALLRQHPVKYTSIVDSIAECNDFFAYISKKNNSTDRRCCVFWASPETTKDVVDTLEEAIEISTETSEMLENGRKTPTPSNFHHSRNGSSGAATPTPPSIPSQGAKYSKLFVHPWYHGMISREAAVQLLKNPGDFLIRESSKNQNQLILSAVCERNFHRHLELFSGDGLLRVGDLVFRAVEDMIDHFKKEGTPISSPNVSTNMYLTHPIYRSN